MIPDLLVPLIIGFLLASIFGNIADLIAGTRSLNPHLDNPSVRRAEEILRNMDGAIRKYREDNLEEITDV